MGQKVEILYVLDTLQTDRDHDMSEKAQAALSWIVEILNRHHVPFQVVGGAAARAYGAQRPLVDIDLYAPLDQASAALEEIKPHIVQGPQRYISESWNLTFLKINYQDQQIEIGDTSTNPQFYNHRDGRWEKQNINFAQSQLMSFLGTSIPVIPLDELIRYKTMLGREVDRQDVAELSE